MAGTKVHDGGIDFLHIIYIHVSISPRVETVNSSVGVSLRTGKGRPAFIYKRVHKQMS